MLHTVSAAWLPNPRGASAEGEGLYKPYGMGLPCFEYHIIIPRVGCTHIAR